MRASARERSAWSEAFHTRREREMSSGGRGFGRCGSCKAPIGLGVSIPQRKPERGRLAGGVGRRETRHSCEAWEGKCTKIHSDHEREGSAGAREAERCFIRECLDFRGVFARAGESEECPSPLSSGYRKRGAVSTQRERTS